MKYLKVIAIISFQFACSNRNDLTTHLLNEKKILNDSIAHAKIKQENYFVKAFTEKRNGSDSLTWSALEDTSFIYDRQVIQMQQRIKAINFSIDSLSRMK